MRRLPAARSQPEQQVVHALDVVRVELLLRSGPVGARVAPILPPRNGFLFLDKAKFHDAYTADLDKEESEYLAGAQVPAGPVRSSRRSRSRPATC